MDLRDLLGRKLDPAQIDEIVAQIRLRGEQDEMRDRSMAENIRILQRSVDELAGAVAEYNLQLRAISNRLDNLSKLMSREEPLRPTEQPHGSTSTTVGDRPVSPQPEPKPKAASRRFYATLDPEGGLREVGDNYRNKAPIVATVTGDTGEAAFNVECLGYCLPRAESAILPFFDYTIESSTPSTVIPHNTARITRHGDVWEMSQRMKITLS